MPTAHGLYVAQEFRYWEKQAIAQLNQSPPVQNTWYEVLAAHADCRIIWLVLRQDNDEVAAKDCEIRATIDGVALVGSGTLNSGTYYQAYLNLSADTLIITGTKFNAGYYVDIRGKNVKVEVRITDPVGTNQVLRGRVQHEDWEAT